MILLSLLLLSLNCVYVKANVRCAHESPPRIPKYYLLEKCRRSKLSIAAKANYTSLSSCQRLGIEKKALALNFIPPEVARMSEEPVDYTCEVLKCAEAEGGLSLANDTRYDYYSIYAKPIPNVNSTCVPATGMFRLLTKKFNYTEAVTECKNLTGALAGVASEQRTDTLAQLLAGASVDAALVGMRRENQSSFYNVNGEALDCTTYRAWAPGHPRRNHYSFGCVVITRNRTWQSVSCKKKYPVLCELIPGGPYLKGSLFAPARTQNMNDSSMNSKGEQADTKESNQRA